MKIVKNIAVGFGISFIGSIPLGYLNVIGYDVYNRLGTASLVGFILGVMTVESLVIYFTLVFAKKLSKRKKLLKYIELFSIFFLLALAIGLFLSSESSESSDDDILSKYIQYPAYIIGIILSCFNFIQLPFWTGWNLYLLTNKYIIAGRYLKFYYLAGTLFGTFTGMIGFVYLLHAITGTSESISNNLMSLILPLIFLGLALFQALKFYRKYYARK